MAYRHYVVNNFTETLGNIRETDKDKEEDLRVFGKREAKRLCC